MLTGLALWMWLAGVVFLVFGLFSVRKELSFKLDSVPALGRVFVPVGLAMFAAEHFAAAKSLMQIVPRFVPVPLFWTYFVGFALLAAATSIVVMKYQRLSASLAGLMFLLFVLMIHLPRVIANPKDRFAWAVVAREVAFACGVWMFAGRFTQPCRVVLGAILVFYAAEHFLHPSFIPGVPLGKMTPAWIPVPALWGYITGLALLAGGAALLVNQQARRATTWLGIVLALMVLFIYLPVLASAITHRGNLIEALNYIGDTTLFAGTVLLAAGACPPSKQS